MLPVAACWVAAACEAPREPAPEVGTDRQAQADEARDWRHGGTCYEIFVRSFHDSDGDGIGDLPGLAAKLDYVNDGDPGTRDDLGANCIWLMPVAASPSYHGYDVTDYYRVNPDYGTNEDFKELTAAAHERGIRVLVDMVINHTSDRHPWFLEAAADPESPYRDWYHFSPVPGPDNEYGDNNWRRSPERDEYYYGFFSHRMPDLNWETDAVRREMKRAASFWLGEMGADGLRLDAVRHLMENDAGVATNVPRTHDMLREYGEYVRAEHPGSFTVGEVFDETGAILSYYPDQLDAYFAFGVAEAILTAVRDGTGTGLLEEVLEVQAAVPNDRWAPFLRNHDQTRTVYWLDGDLARAKLAASLLLTLPGVPFVYYGEELGMLGGESHPSVRRPMHWEVAPAAGFTTGEPWEPLGPDSLTASVEVLSGDRGSILDLYRNLIHLRAAHPALGVGELIPLEADAPSTLAYLRTHEGNVMLVVANLGEEPLEGVAFSSEDGVLEPGSYVAETLLGSRDGARLEVGVDGRVTGYVPLATLKPLRVEILAVLAASDTQVR